MYHRVSCPICGDYELNVALFPPSWKPDPLLRSQIAGVIRESCELNRERFRISNRNIDEIAAMAPHNLEERARRLLTAIGRRTTYFGEILGLEPAVGRPLGYCQNEHEFVTMVRYLTERNLITNKFDAHRNRFEVVLEAKGHAELASRDKSNLESSTAFVAMWFDDVVKPAYFGGIRPAIEAAGYESVRIDLEEHNDDIMDRVFSEIRRARFVVADFTQQRNGVYFESGFALGLGITVIWTCRERDAGEAHFDTEHFNHVIWSTPDELRERLERRIVATVGDGPLEPR